jgi:6-phosphogluconolactonase (cycloisomerase 2 family)
VLSFDLAGAGGLTATGNVASRGRASSWLAVTKDGRYLFTTNTLSDTVSDITTGTGAISRFSVASDGKLTLLWQANTGPAPPSDRRRAATAATCT